MSTFLQEVSYILTDLVIGKKNQQHNHKHHCVYIGVALYHSEDGPLANNSVVVANNGF